jgi:hypothetical protein
MKKFLNIMSWALILAPAILFLASYSEVVALNLTTQDYSWWNIFNIFA